MRTAILAALLVACAPSTPPADGPAAGWLDVDDGRGPQPLTECTTRPATWMGDPVTSLVVRASQWSASFSWEPGASSLRGGSFNDCPMSDCGGGAGVYHTCLTGGTITEANGAWLVDAICDDGEHVTIEVTSCERL